MNDKTWIIIGLIFFVGIFTSPFWSNAGKSIPAPKIELTEKAKAAGECILPKIEMKTKHMKILDDWREQVVRTGERIYKAPNGKEYNMSLSNSCLDCHSNKAQFCDRCHDYASVKPYCWTCHVDPNKSLKENK